jgi:pimeloyl-ACP methyl ester carboxylesterase
MKKLVVFVSGFNGLEQEWAPLRDRLTGEDLLVGSDTLIFTHYGFGDIGKIFKKSVREVSRILKTKIEEKCIYVGLETYDEIICISHSMGGLLIREAYLLSAGAYSGEPKSKVAWTDKVTRFVLLASPNEGWEPKNPLGLVVVNMLSAMGVPLLNELIHGSAFITNLRISWIRYIASLDGQEPVVVQVLGLDDQIVRKEDSHDIKQFPNGIQLDVSDTNHTNIYRPCGKDDKSIEQWEKRYKVLSWATLRCNPRSTEIPADIPNIKEIDIGSKSRATDVIFIIHGIRDSNSGWASELEYEIEKITNGAVTVVRPTYGYFSALDFLVLQLRRKNVRWFQDQYTEQLASNPKAEFYFIGHSNGTYILGEGLKRVPEMRFKRIYLAGSVLPCEYPWQPRFDLKQVEELRNDRSSQDWPVGILCSGLRGFGMKDLGTGGFDGFRFDNSHIEEVFYYDGGHGKPLDKGNQNSILAFILEGRHLIPPNLLASTQISARFKRISLAAPHIAKILLMILLLILLLPLYLAFPWSKPIFLLLVFFVLGYSVYTFIKTL